jgi:hypothetical protein
MLRLRTHVLISLGFLAGLLVLGWGGALLAGLGGPVPTGAWRWVFLAAMFALMLGFAFSAVPVMVLLVTGAQARLRTPLEGLAAPRWQNAIVYTLWALMALGTAIALPAAYFLGAFGDFGLAAPRMDPGDSQGTLVAKPGMTVDELVRASSLPMHPLPSPAVISDDIVFDFNVAGTAIRFPRCRYYYITTFIHDREHIEGMSIGTAYEKMDLTALAAMDLAARRQLAADGWLAGHEEFRTPDDQALHGGALRGPEGDLWLKDGIVLDIGRKRMDEAVDGEDAGAGEWIQTVSLWAQADYPWIERYEFAVPEAATLQ